MVCTSKEDTFTSKEDTFSSNEDTSHPGASLFDVRSWRVVHQKRILFHQMRILFHQMWIHSVPAMLFKFLVHQKRILFWRFAIKKSRFVHQKRILCTSKEDTTYIKRGYFFIKRGYCVHQKRILLQGFSKRLFKRASRENHVRMPEPPRCGRAARPSVRVAVFVVPNSRWPCKRVMASVLAHPRSSSVEVPGFIVQLSRK